MVSSSLSVAVSSPRKRFYEFAWRQRGLVTGALAASLTALGLLGLGALTAPAPPGPAARILALVLGALSVVLAALWLALPAWFSPGFRLLAWRAARAGSWLRRTLAHLWIGWIVRAAVVVVILWAAFEAFGGGAEGVAAVLGSLLLVAFVWTVGLSWRRIFVADFKDFTAEDPDKGVGAAIASRLRNELASIVALYVTVQESTDIGLQTPGSRRKSEEIGKIRLKNPSEKVGEVGLQRKGRALGVGVQDLASELGQTIGRDFNIKLWGVEIPIGILLAAAGGFLRGPRLSGSLHRDGEKYVLIAEISGGGKQGSWRVSEDDLPEEGRGANGPAVVPRLVVPLAYRIITGLQDMGSPRWEAVRAFSEGLRSYRNVQRTRKDYHLHLRRAERSFISALSEDDRFVQCHYNLGVVYRMLEQWNSAEAEFRQAIETDPDRFDSYHALATYYYENSELKNAEIYATKALALKPGDIEAWNLRGLACAERAPGPDENEPQVWAKVNESLSLATALAWRGHCGSIWRRGPDSVEAKDREDLAVIATGNLAETRMRQTAGLLRTQDSGKSQKAVSGAWASAAMFQHALRLRPRDPFLYLGLGRAFLLSRDWEKARSALFLAYGDGLPPLYRPFRWACLAVADQRLGRNTQGDRRNFLDFIVPPEEYVLGLGLRSQSPDAESTVLNEYLKMLDALQIELERLAAWTTVGRNNPVAPLRRAVRALNALECSETAPARTRAATQKSGKRGWLRAQAHIHSARLSIAAHPNRARGKLVQAFALLGEDHFRQIEKQGLFSLLALTNLRVGRITEDTGLLQAALTQAEISVRQEPLSPLRRWVLAEVYSALKDSRQLLDESKAALDLGSVPEILGNPEALASMAEEWFRRAAGIPAADARRAELERAFQFFDHVRELIESAPIQGEQRATHAALHFWLGRLRCELADCVRGAGHLEIARTMGYRPIQTRLILGQTYADSDAFAKAKDVFREAAYQAWKGVWARTHGRRAASKPGPSDDTHPPAELLAEALLRLALLYVDEDIRVRQAEQLTRIVMTRRPGKINSGLSVPRRSDLRALSHEILGRVHLADRKVDWALEELRQAVELQPSAGAWSALAMAQVEKAALGGERELHLLEARQACDRAERLDLRGTCRREIVKTKARVLEIARSTATATAPGAPAAQVEEAQPELVF